MADRKGKANATWASMDVSPESGSSGPDNNSAPTGTSEDDVTSDSGRGESAEVIDATPTTTEEAMDNAVVEDGFADESAYAPTDR